MPRTSKSYATPTTLSRSATDAEEKAPAKISEPGAQQEVQSVGTTEAGLLAPAGRSANRRKPAPAPALHEPEPDVHEPGLVQARHRRKKK
jgi:hypothetical protein